MESTSTARATARTWCGLIVLLIPALLASMDVSVLFVAGPAIGEALRLTSTQWLWAMDVYSFVAAGLLITMGSLGDRVGRRRLLLIGAALFGVASTVLAYATDPASLIGGRAALAIGGATLAPSTLSLIRGMFHDENQRRAAVGAWTVAFAGGAIAGPIIGGALLEHFWWGSVFLINVPFMVLLLAAGPLLIGESRNPTRTRFDLSGAATLLLAVVSLVFGLKHATRHSLDATAAGAAFVGAVAAGLFLLRQTRARYPLIDLGLFRLPAFSTAVGANTLLAMATAGLGVLAFPFLQLVHRLSPLQSALWAIATFAGSIVGAALAAAMAGRLAATTMLRCGLAIAAAGLLVVSAVRPDVGVWMFLAGYTTLTLGIGIAATIANSLVLTSAPSGRAGAASGISETSTQLGQALGIATFGTLASAIYRSDMLASAPDGTASAALETLAGAVDAARSADLLEPAYAAYTHGLTVTALTGAILTALLAATISAALRSKRR